MQELKQGSEIVSLRKFHVPCGSRVTSQTPTTQTWLNGLQYLSTIDQYKADMSHKQILEGILDGHKDVVVKVADKSEDIKREYDRYTELVNNNVQGIVHYYCYFECNDDLKRPASVKTLCQGPGDSMRILVMEYIKDKSFALNRWQNVDAIKSIIKQVLCIAIDAYVKFGFVHGDLHCQNILFKKTAAASQLAFTYSETNRTVHINTSGYKAKLMDFELSKTQQPVRAFMNDIALCLGSSLTRYIADYVTTPSTISSLVHAMVLIKERTKSPSDVYQLFELFPLIDMIS